MTVIFKYLNLSKEKMDQNLKNANIIVTKSKYDLLENAESVDFYPHIKKEKENLTYLIMLCQLCKLILNENNKALKIGYNQLQKKYFPWIEIKQIARIIKILEEQNLITVSKTVGEINSYYLTKESKSLITNKHNISYEVKLYLPLLNTNKLDINESIILSKIHNLIHFKGSLVTSYPKMYSNYFMFLSLPTVKRAMSNLVKTKILIREPIEQIEEENHNPYNRYKINYNNIEQLFSNS